MIAARVSTKRDGGQDPTTQRDKLRAAAARLGYDVVAEVVEHSSAWQDQKAAEWEKKVFEAVVSSGADVLMVWALDRFTRRKPGPALRLVERLEKHHGVALYSLQEPFLSTATADPAMRDLLLSLFSWVAEQESARRSARVNAKVEAKKNRAEAIGQRAKWGRGSMPTAADVQAVWRLRSQQGFNGRPMPVRGIAVLTGLSKSTVQRILDAGPVPMEREGQGEAPGGETRPSEAGGLGQGVASPIASETGSGDEGEVCVVNGAVSDAGGERHG